MVMHTNKRPFACATCNKSFTKANVLKQHMKQQHEKAKPLLRCVYLNCTATFKLRKDLRVHEQIKYRGAEAFHCEICNKDFLKVGIYRQHMKYHGPKQYGCPYCGKTFAIKSALKSHMDRHTDISILHQSRIEKTYQNAC